MPIKEWRNEQIFHLRQKEPLTDEMQETYYKTVIVPLFALKQPSQILFSFLLDGQCIGYGGLVHIDWKAKCGEVSFLVETQRCNDNVVYQTDFTAFLELIKCVARDHLQFHRIFTETYARRPHHIAILESQGFQFENLLKDHVWKNGQSLDSLIHGCNFNE